MGQKRRTSQLLLQHLQFQSFQDFQPTHASCYLAKRTINSDEPTYLGAVILDFSKVQLFKFHFQEILSKYDPNAKLLYKDTDSLFCEIQTKDVYKDFEGFKDHMDFSAYSRDHFLFSSENEKKSPETDGRVEQLFPLRTLKESQ